MKRLDNIISHEKFVNSDIDAILIAKPENALYILGFKVESEVLILITREGLDFNGGMVWVFLNALEYDQAKLNIEGDKDLSKVIEIKQIPPGKPNFIHRTIKKLKLKSLGFEDNYISVKRYNDWKNRFAIESFEGISEIISDARLIKTQDELDRIKKAAELGDIGFKAVYETIEKDKTEKELAAIAEYEMRKAGSDGTSFDTIVASGERSAYPYATTSDKKIQEGDIIIVDIGARYMGYCSDMTRTFIYGKESQEKTKIINLVNEGQEFALENLKAGLLSSELDKLIRDFFIQKDKEMGSRFIHSLGHGVGIDIHENPYLSPVSQSVLKENMVVTIEPGLYFPGLGGARTEDLVVIKNEGYESFSKSKKFYY